MWTVGLPSTLATARLRLRPARLEDADDMFERWARDIEVARYLTWRPYHDIALVRAYLVDALEAQAQGRRWLWSIEQRETAQLVGQISAHPEGPRVMLGYVLARAYWGRGYMTEAVRALNDAILDRPGYFRVWAVADIDNPASARVMEKAGMTFEGRLRRWIIHPNVSAEPRDVHCYARVR